MLHSFNLNSSSVFFILALLLALSQCQEDFITVHYTAENFITQDEQVCTITVNIIHER